MDDHIDVVYQIIEETLTSGKELPFPGFRELLQKVLVERRPSASSLPWLLLPILTCEALGGNVRQAQQVAAALEVGRVAAGCLDEWQDQDTHDALWQALGAARTVNLSMSLISLSFLTLNRLTDLGVGRAQILRLHEEFHQTLLEMSAGQDADLAEDLTPDSYERVAGAKSGSLFRLGCRAGALIAGAPAEVIARYGEYGYNLGIVAQMWNDLQGLNGVQGKADSQHERSLPILAGRAAQGTESSPTPREGQLGPLYALVRLQVYHQRAAAALEACPQAGRLSLFIDSYATRRLVEKAQQTNPYAGGDRGG